MARKQMIDVSTKTGDDGQSSLASGERLDKDDLVFEAIGTIDELNSWLGLIVERMGESFAEHRQQLIRVQDTLFYLGAELARSPKVSFKSSELSQIEQISQALQAQMSTGWHTKFILPGGTELGAHLDIARTVCRRAERRLVAYSNQYQVRSVLIKYLNRLSDYLYVLRCYVNFSVAFKEKEFRSK